MESSSLDPDQTRRFVGPNLVPNYIVFWFKADIKNDTCDESNKII